MVGDEVGGLGRGWVIYLVDLSKEYRFFSKCNSLPWPLNRFGGIYDLVFSVTISFRAPQVGE